MQIGVSEDNSYYTPLNGYGSWTGSFEDVSPYSSVIMSLNSNSSGSLIVDFSPDAINVDSSITYNFDSNVNEVHRLVVTRKWFRTRIYNAASVSQSHLRFQTILGNQTLLSSPLNLSVQQDADAIIVRAIDSELDISNGKYNGYTIVNKFGRNSDIDTATVPEDLWNGGGVYAGFPTGSADEFQVFSSSTNDIGVLSFTYLTNTSSTSYSTSEVRLTGTTPVNTGIIGHRMHTARYNSETSTGFNLGTITIRHRNNNANIFCQMPIGRSQTNVAAYTVPNGHTAYIKRLFARVVGSTTGTADGSLWIRGLNEGPRLRRPFTITQNDAFNETIYGGLAIAAGSDIMIRISASSVNNLDVVSGYDLILIKNT
jgi:hypothetical protein